MPESKLDLPIPNGYARLAGSERRFSPKAKSLGPIQGREEFSVTIVLRRRADGPPMPGLDYFTNTPPRMRDRLSSEEFTAKYGAHPDDINAVTKFATEHGLEVTKVHAGRRHVVLTGTADQFSRAFGVTFSQFEVPGRKSFRSLPVSTTRKYRDHEGFVHIPQNLSDIIVGVFGLDNAPVGARGNYPGDPPIINPVTVKQVTQLYKFPTPGATIGGQTIGIITTAGANGGGYLQSDLDLTFSNVGLTAPKVIPISVEPGVNNATYTAPTTAAGNIGDATLSFANTSNINPNLVATYTYSGVTYMIQLYPATATTADVYTYIPATQTAGEDFAVGTWTTGLTTIVPKGTVVSINLDGETNQDIAISALAAAGANVVDYFTTDTQKGWVDLIGRVLHPEAGDFPPGVSPPSVLSSSWVIAVGDDTNGLAIPLSGTGVVTTATLLAMSASFQDAAILQNGPTICVCSMDFGSFSQISDGYAHVSYPSSDPWILSCGGTTLGQYLPPSSTVAEQVEYAWNDPAPGQSWGASGGGVSAYFPVPSYQSGAGIPKTINTGITGNPVQTVPTTGRGVPDVAANASLNSGYSGLYMGGGLSIYPGNGTSAAAPLWAGLIAVLNANAGFNFGFANPSLYSFPASDFCPITPLWPDPANPALANCPANNGDSGTPGYPTRAGWDAVTGLGSPNGMNLLASIQELEQVYILGGYQSPDIIITDLSNNQPVPIGGLPGGRWDTLLEPSTNYGFSANVHNDSSTTANNVVVSFWAIPGGVGTNGSAVGTPQTVSIPAHSTVNVSASAPFTSAPAGQHLCAVVSLYSPATGCNTNATTALQIPNPGYSDTHQCSAWRNTDSMLVMMGQRFKFNLGFGRLPFQFEEPIILKLVTTHIPATIVRDPVINNRQNTLRALGATPNLPLYLLPGFERNFHVSYLKTKLIAADGSRLEERSAGEWHLYPHRKATPVNLEIAGEIAASAKTGDVILVNVTAQYPAFERHPARKVDFLEFLHVTDKLPKRDRVATKEPAS
jgi:hypothetical protein